MLSYRVILDVPFQLVVFVSELLAGHRREIGTRTGTRALTCWKQAVFTIAWFPTAGHPRLGAGFGISQATAYRYKNEAREVLAAKAPTLHQVLDRAVEQGLSYTRTLACPELTRKRSPGQSAVPHTCHTPGPRAVNSGSPEHEWLSGQHGCPSSSRRERPHRSSKLVVPPLLAAQLLRSRDVKAMWPSL